MLCRRPLLRYTVRRLLGAIPTLFILTALAFFMIRAAPGGPFDAELLRLKDNLSAELLAGAFEDASVEDAAVHGPAVNHDQGRAIARLLGEK